MLIPVFEDPTLELSNRFEFAASNILAKHKTAGVVRGTRHLGMLLGREDVPERCDYPFAIHQEFLPITVPAAVDRDDHLVQLSWDWPEREPRPHYVSWPPKMPRDTVDDRGEQIIGYCNMGRKRILAVASGDEWPHDAYTFLRELSHPNSINTIEEGGVGFLAAGSRRTSSPSPGASRSNGRCPARSPSIRARRLWWRWGVEYPLKGDQMR